MKLWYQVRSMWKRSSGLFARILHYRHSIQLRAQMDHCRECFQSVSHGIPQTRVGAHLPFQDTLIVTVRKSHGNVCMSSNARYVVLWLRAVCVKRCVKAESDDGFEQSFSLCTVRSCYCLEVSGGRWSRSTMEIQRARNQVITGMYPQQQ